MDLYRAIRMLVDFGFSRVDAKVYMYLAKMGPKKGKELAVCLQMPKQQLYPCLKNLRQKEIVKATDQHPASFSAIPFEEVLNLSISSRIKEAQTTLQNKLNLLETWKSLTQETTK